VLSVGGLEPPLIPPPEVSAVIRAYLYAAVAASA